MRNDTDKTPSSLLDCDGFRRASWMVIRETVLGLMMDDDDDDSLPVCRVGQLHTSTTITQALDAMQSGRVEN